MQKVSKDISGKITLQVHAKEILEIVLHAWAELPTSKYMTLNVLPFKKAQGTQTHKCPWQPLFQYMLSSKWAGVGPVLTLPVPGTWLKSPSRDRTLCCVSIPASSFALTASSRPSTNSAILSPAEAVCCSCSWSLGGKLLLGQHPKGWSFNFVLKCVFSQLRRGEKSHKAHLLQLYLGLSNCNSVLLQMISFSNKTMVWSTPLFCCWMKVYHIFPKI